MSTNQWFEKFKKGDESAMVQVYDLHYRAVLYFAGTILGHAEVGAEDIVLESFTKLWRNRAKIETERHLENYLYFVTRNGCVSAQRSNKVQKGLRESLSALQEDHNVDSVLDHEKMQAQLVDRIGQYLHGLPNGEVVRLSYLEGKSTAEIAQLLNTTENNVYIMKSRGLKALRVLLKGENYKPLALVLLLAGTIFLRQLTTHFQNYSKAFMLFPLRVICRHRL